MRESVNHRRPHAVDLAPFYSQYDKAAPSPAKSRDTGDQHRPTRFARRTRLHDSTHPPRYPISICRALP